MTQILSPAHTFLELSVGHPSNYPTSSWGYWPGIWNSSCHKQILTTPWESCLSSQKMACMLAKSLQMCLTLCDPMDCGPPGSSVHGILQSRILEWLVDLPDPEIKPRSTDLQANSLPFEAWGNPTQTSNKYAKSNLFIKKRKFKVSLRKSCWVKNKQFWYCIYHAYFLYENR